MEDGAGAALSSSSSGVSLYSMLPQAWSAGGRPPSATTSSGAVPVFSGSGAYALGNPYYTTSPPMYSQEAHDDEDHDDEEHEEEDEEEEEHTGEYGQGSGYEGYDDEAQLGAYGQGGFHGGFGGYGASSVQHDEEAEQEEDEDEQEEEEAAEEAGHQEEEVEEEGTADGGEEEQHYEEPQHQGRSGFMEGMGPYGMPWYAGLTSPPSHGATPLASSSSSSFSFGLGSAGSNIQQQATVNPYSYGMMYGSGSTTNPYTPFSPPTAGVLGVSSPPSASAVLETSGDEHVSELVEYPKHSQPWNDDDVPEEEEEEESQDEEPAPTTSSSSSSSAVGQSSTAREATLGGSESKAEGKQTNQPDAPSKSDPVPDFQRPVWVEDKYAASCAKCTIDFSTFKRRHHCRGCGKVFCAECSGCFLVLPSEFGYKTPQRTCRGCYVKYSTIDYTKKYDTFGPVDAPSDYRLVVPDLPGHGSRDNQQFTMQTAMDVVEEVIRAHSPEKRAIIFGYGLGGFVAMSLAGARPYLCRAIIVGAAASNQTERGGLFLSILSYMWSSIPKPLLSRAGRVSLDKYTRISEEQANKLFLCPGIQYSAWPDILTAVGTHDFGKNLTLYPGPVLFFHGQHDNRHSEQEWSRAARKAKVEVIEDAGQWVLVDQRYHARVSALVHGFIQDVFRAEEEEEKRKEEEREREIARRSAAQRPQPAAATAAPAPQAPQNDRLFKDADWLFAKE